MNVRKEYAVIPNKNLITLIKTRKIESLEKRNSNLHKNKTLASLGES